jgi:arginine-tRNA-protein transferase
MESFLRYIAPSTPCGYLRDQYWRLEFEHCLELSADEYMDRLLTGWRRFGHVLFRPRCRKCTACQSLRVPIDRFRPDRSQRRARKTNDGVRLEIHEPSVSPEKLALYDRYHNFQSQNKGWPLHPAKDPDEYAWSFAENPFPTEEWRYYLGHELIGVGYVDILPSGVSAIYFYYDPGERQRSLGTWNVLNVIDAAAKRDLPYAYLGYYVAGCPSMLYKARFRPNEILYPDGVWRGFLD